MGATNDNEMMDTSTDAGYEGSAIIAGTAFGPIFIIEDASLHLENVSLRNASVTTLGLSGMSGGGGLSLVNAEVMITGCEFEDMFAELSGGGINAIDSRLVVNNSVFRRCISGPKPELGTEELVIAGGGIKVGASGV